MRGGGRRAAFRSQSEQFTNASLQAAVLALSSPERRGSTGIMCFTQSFEKLLCLVQAFNLITPLDKEC